MDNPPGMVFDVDAASFAQEVVEASHHQAIVVDFWADWCGPCRMLGPILEKLVPTYTGRLRLAKVNVDRNQQLAREYNVQSIPSVKIFRNGDVVDEFVGVKSEQEIKRMLDTIVGDETGDALAHAESLAADGDYDKAKDVFTSLLEGGSRMPRARLGLARIEIERGNDDTAESHLDAIDELDEEYADAEALRIYLDMKRACQAAGGIDVYRESAADDTSPEASYRSGCCNALTQEYAAALEDFLKAVAADNGEIRDKARKGMIAVFGILGADDDLTRDYRNRLAQTLF